LGKIYGGGGRGGCRGSRGTQARVEKLSVKGH
jgi:hypothetical protein